jgi:choline dehydrogenase-like flavoprotein
MNERVIVVGSGASGVHFARTLLEKGRRVLMLDVGRPRPEPVNPADDLNGLKSNLEDPVAYFLGRKYEALITPGHESEYYGFPAHKQYIFRETPEFRYGSSGFSPLVSFAAGGLAEAWTGGSYPFNDEELAAFPFGYKDIEPFYSEVARRIGITGAEDDLARFFPMHGGLIEPLALDEHSEVLAASYRKHSAWANGKLGCYLGRARVATLSHDRDGRMACSYCGRCLWGCPSGALYTPLATLGDCLKDPNFEYVDSVHVSHLRVSGSGRVTSVIAHSTADGAAHEFEAASVALAAGTLCSSKIFLDTMYRETARVPELRGLMDNRQILMPFVNLKLIGRRFEPRTYQYHQLAIGLAGGNAMEYVHGLVTTLKTAMIHPVVQSLPFDLATSVCVFRNLHAALGLVNVNFSDFRREENLLTLEPEPGSARTRLAIRYSPEAGEPARVRKAQKTLQRFLRKLGCIAPSAMAHVRPMGASVHYAGTVPMTAEAAPLTADPLCRSRDIENLYFVDGTTFPALPSKNLTLTLMANATRVARCAF